MEKLWPQVLNLIREDINEGSFTRWFGTVSEVRRQDNKVFIVVPNDTAAAYMESKFGQMLAGCLKDVAGEKLEPVFITEDALLDQEIRKASTRKTTGFAFNPRYTFDTFVVGKSNRFTHAAALAVAENPSSYNPLFIYGGSGLGKTHLMHAIGQTVQQTKPHAKVVYVTTESFTNEFIALVRTGQVNAMKARYRNADVLLIDDIQFLSNKIETQEEFFHTFNALHEAGKQIVITSDRKPEDINDLDDRLRSRFRWGLTTDMQMPDIETRIAILQHKAANENITIPFEVLEFIADNIKSNVRELEGALNKVIYYCMLNQMKSSDLTVEIAAEELRDILPSFRKAPLSIESIQKTVADFYKVSVDELKSQKRERSIVYPRQIAMYLCRELLDVSLPKIGREFGGRDHTTVLHSCDKINKEAEYDLSIDAQIKKLREILEK